MKPLLHVEHVEVSDVVVAQVLVIHTDHLHLAQTQAEQQTLESLEIQPVFLAVAPEQLLDVEALLLLQRVALGTLGVRGHRGPFHVRILGNLQVAVVVVGVVVSVVLMAVPVSMAVVALIEEEGEHTQETELGVHVDSHCPLTSGPRNAASWPPVLTRVCVGDRQLF